MSFTVYLTTPDLRRIPLTVHSNGPGVYEVVMAAGFGDLTDRALAFDISALPADVQNLDCDSVSFTEMGLSEQMKTPEMQTYGFLLKAPNLQQVQGGLDRLRGRIVDLAPYLD